MATSGTVGLTVLDATSMIEHAVRRCGVLASAITAEMQSSARDNLFLILSAFATKGMQLWCTQKAVYPLLQGVNFLTLDVGTVDVLNALVRTVVSNAATAIAAGAATYTPAAAVLVNSVTLTVPAGAYQFVLEASADSVNWRQYGARAVSPVAAMALSFDADISIAQPYWRVRETLAGTVVATAASFLTAANEIPMSKLSRDDYSSLPNKAFASAQTLQFWYDKQFYQPRMWLWPVPQDALHQCVVWAQRQIQDVGDLSNQIEAPQRWWDAAIFELSTRVFLELPKQLVEPSRYQILLDKARETLGDAMDSEIDGAPVRMGPDISGYTR